jgi:hypothetical protein
MGTENRYASDTQETRLPLPLVHTTPRPPRRQCFRPGDHELRDGGQPFVVRKEETREERARDAVDTGDEQRSSGKPRTGPPRMEWERKCERERDEKAM